MWKVEQKIEIKSLWDKKFLEDPTFTPTSVTINIAPGASGADKKVETSSLTVKYPFKANLGKLSPIEGIPWVGFDAAT